MIGVASKLFSVEEIGRSVVQRLHFDSYFRIMIDVPEMHGWISHDKCWFR